MNNARGDWLESILKVIFWNTLVDVCDGGSVIFKLPNASQLQFRHLYEDRARGYLDELFASLAERGMNMQMSNPDFLCLTGIEEGAIDTEHRTISMDALDELDNLYQQFVGECPAEAIPFVLTVKSSVRPDRRYQAVHEANVVKALVAHLAGRFWKQELYTGFYAMIAATVSASDRQVLSNPATHTLVQVSWTPVPLLDGVYEIDDVADLTATIEELLDHYNLRA